MHRVITFCYRPKGTKKTRIQKENNEVAHIKEEETRPDASKKEALREFMVTAYVSRTFSSPHAISILPFPGIQLQSVSTIESAFTSLPIQRHLLLFVPYLLSYFLSFVGSSFLQLFSLPLPPTA